MATRAPRITVGDLQRCVQPREQTLGRGLFVAGGAVDLPGEEQAADGLGLERRLQCARIVVVVLDRVAWAQDVGALEADHRTDEFDLDVERKTGRDAVRVDLVGRQAFRLEEDLVRVLVGEAVDLVLDRRTVARADTLDHAGVHRRAVEPAADDLVGSGVRVGDPARQLLRMLGGAAEEREHRDRIAVAGLNLETGEVDRAPIDSRRGSGLEAALRQGEVLQTRTQRRGGRIAGATCRVVLQTDVDQPIEEGARRDDDCPRVKSQTDLRDGTDHPIALDDQVVHGLLEEPEVRLVLEAGSDCLAVQHTIRLRPRGPDGRAFAGVEDPKLDPGLIGGRCHRAAERVDFLDQVPLADPADRRVARHLTERLDVVSQEQGPDTHPGSRECGLGTRMAATHDDHIELFREVHGGR